MADEHTSSMVVSSSSGDAQLGYIDGPPDASDDTIRQHYNVTNSRSSGTRKDYASSTDKNRVRSRSRSSNRRHHSRRSESKRSRSKNRERRMRDESPSHSRHFRSRDHSHREHYRSRSRDSCLSHQKRESKRRVHKYWDIPPVGFENISPSEYKSLQASGQVPVSVLTNEGTLVQPDYASELATGASALSRQARRIYCGNIPLGTSDQILTSFINSHLKQHGLTQADGDPIISVQLNPDKNFAFLEFRSVDETTACLNLDGLNFGGYAIRLRRPRDYVPVPGGDVALKNMTGANTSSVVQDTPHKLFIGGLPHYLNEEQVKELLVSFGALRGFNLVKDTSTGLSKGYAFCEYVDHSITDTAILGLTGMQLGDKKIVVQRASLGAKAAAVSAVTAALGVGINAAVTCTNVLCLLNMVLPEELTNADEYKAIFEDVREECRKYGRVRSLQIPRPDMCKPLSDQADRVGKIFVEYETNGEAFKAERILSGRKFAGRLVVTSFYDPQKYHSGEF